MTDTTDSATSRTRVLCRVPVPRCETISVTAPAPVPRASSRDLATRRSKPTCG
ncbi:hypothetical protein SAMN06297387_103112 [Streptomyces zhaozhouensis]|uniref:Uncharacterized protein n=1 Tax=Streptomyces zhaozhouensis TaxID=1300267 RepID=A0A286DRU9_9ACTN|nr:hypothetical protein SAMN06297387_103112 [Streptomyces zhaozhouensis]